MGGFGVAGGGPFKIRVGQIVESDGDRQTKQILDAAEQGCLDFVAMAHEKVGGPVKLHQRHGIEVHTEEFAEGAAFAEPSLRREIAARRCAIRLDQAAGDGGALNAIEAEVRVRIGSMPNQSMAARPAASTPADRGRMSCNEVISTSAKSESLMRIWPGKRSGRRRRPVARALDAAETGPATTRAGGVTLCQGFDGLGSGSMPACPARRASMRVHRRGQSLWGRSNWRPRLSRVIWRTCLPVRSEIDETEREVGFAIGFIPGQRVLRMNMVGSWGVAAGAVNRPLIILWHYISFSKNYRRKSWGFREFVTVCGKKSVKDGY